MASGYSKAFVRNFSALEEGLVIGAFVILGMIEIDGVHS